MIRQTIRAFSLAVLDENVSAKILSTHLPPHSLGYLLVWVILANRLDSHRLESRGPLLHRLQLLASERTPENVR